MATPQHEFTVGLPTQDNATPPNTLAAGEITSVVFVVSGVNYPYTVPTGTAAGATLTVPFTAVGFVPTNGTAYTADVYAVDANGNGTASPSVAWTQIAPVPSAPTFSVG